MGGKFLLLELRLWFLELHNSPLELKGELQYSGENYHIRGEKSRLGLLKFSPKNHFDHYDSVIL